MPSPSPDATSASSRRLDTLTGLRWWAAFYVFTHHMANFAPLPKVIAPFTHLGYMGVTFFFVLSGFVLTWSSSPSVSAPTFYWRRIARIWPSHMVALLLAIPVFYSFHPAAGQWWVKPVDLGILALSVVLIQGWWLRGDILFSGNPAAWTLTCEFFFYALHPWVMRPLRRLRTRGAVIASAAVLGGYPCYLELVYKLGWHIPPPVDMLAQFLLGMTLGWVLRSGWRPPIPLWAGVSILVSTLVVLAYAGQWFGTTAHLTVLLARFAPALVSAACGAAIVACASRSLSGRPSILAHPIHVRLGEYSYAFYLLHATLIYLFLAHVGLRATSWSNLWWMLAIGAAALASSAVLHHLVEHPFERRMRRWMDNRNGRRAARRRTGVMDTTLPEPADR